MIFIEYRTGNKNKNDRRKLVIIYHVKKNISKC
jgi:hypothetical protein